MPNSRRAPASIDCPNHVVAIGARRGSMLTGDSQRSTSSTAQGSSRLGFGDDAFELVRVCEQREQRVAEPEEGRVGAGGEDETHEREDLLVVELLAVDLGRGQRRDEVVARVAPPLGRRTARGSG